ncbi:uncharacterized protein BYT42DRAFT_560573 [Radiomyces spectabilis]|uniref:uncharacterized protein n=1 Tax=Radiomyces spectabilis TaxID=64574 RepID=UPI00221FA038|nr:uncharacterized protein BYT42DRAFT_560573 [Radiomyces spectabilis]KAI8388580.1 hypothetical protein BYT42DRAFT_560573 [Radiomyces spectabilis]
MTTETKSPVENTVETPMVEAPVQSELEFKVFVGNLSFKTEKDKLVEFFKTAGTVEDVIIIKRFRRSRGFGFVSMSSMEEVENAAKTLDKKELDGRPINVEVARPRSPSSRDRSKNTKKPRRQKKRRSRKARAAETSSDKTESVPETKPEAETKEQSASSATEQEAAPAPSTSIPAGKVKTGKKATRAARLPPRPLTEVSKTAIYVPNLPFSVKDDALAELFKDYKIKSATIPKLKNGRSKGYGIVDMESEEEQKRVLENFGEVMVKNRKVTVKVAMFPGEETATEVEATAAKDNDPDVKSDTDNGKEKETKPQEKSLEKEKTVDAKKDETKEKNTVQDKKSKDQEPAKETKPATANATKSSEKKESATKADAPADKPADKPAKSEPKSEDKSKKDLKETPIVQAVKS